MIISPRMLLNTVQSGFRNFIPNQVGISTLLVTRRQIQHWPESNSHADLFMPKKIEDRQLPLMLYTPVNYPRGVLPPLKHPKANIDMRGPERIHNQLIYRQYGIIALGGGALNGGHLDGIRDRVNKYMDFERFFAVWRVDPPWKAKSKKSLGKKMGGGKAKVHHYETPVRAGRVIIEVAGLGQYGEVERILTSICKKLPLYAMPITQEVMDNLKKEKMELDAKNWNPFEYRDLIRRNFSDSQRFTSPYDERWGGTYF